MKNGLFSKMMAAYSLIISVGFIITATILSFWFQGYYADQRRNQLVGQGVYIQDVALDYINRKTEMDKIQDRLKILGQSSKSDILFVTNYGVVAVTSDAKYNAFIGKQVITKDLEVLRNRKEKDNIIETKNDYKDIFKKSAHVFIFPMYNDSGVFEGAIMMNTPLKNMREPLDKVYSIIWFSAFIAIVGSFLFYIISLKK